MITAAPGFRPAEISSLLNGRVLREHAQEAAFLWTRREQAADAPHYDLEQLGMLDERLLAHLTGLRLGGQAGLALALKGLGEIDTGTVFTAAWIAFHLQAPEAMRHVLAVGLSDPRLTAALVSALSWLDPLPLRPLLQRLMASPAPAHRSVALSVLGSRHGVDREDLLPALRDPDDALRAQAIRVAGEQALPDLPPLLQRLDPAALQPTERFWCQWALALRNPNPDVGTLLITAHEANLRPQGLALAMRVGSPEWARDVIRRLAAEPARQREAIVAMGAFGDPATIPWLLDHCEHPELSRLAAESVALITGVDLEAPDLRRSKGPPELPWEHPDDQQAHWIEPAALRAWWHEAQGRFRAGTRYLGGQVADETAAVRMLRLGTQRQRRHAALELARLRPSMPLFQVDARADWQQQRLDR